MDQLHLMKVFVAVAESEGFASAARQLNMSPPAVTRAISGLEENLGVKLLNRTTRFVRATEVGLRYLDDARRILRDVELANEAAVGINSEPKGELSITAPVLFGERHILPVVVEFLNLYPETSVNAAFLDRTVNLMEEGFDLGIRIGELADSSMRARKIGEVRLVLVASEQYLASHGAPLTPQALKQHSLINSSSNDFSRDWLFMQENEKIKVRIQPRLTVTTNRSAIEAAKAGLGIARAVSYQVADEIRNDQLRPILEDYQSASIPIHVIHRESRLSSTKVRSFIDLLIKQFKSSTIALY